MVPDAATPVLKAATNSNPNPNKGLGDQLHTSGGVALIAYAGPSGTIVDVGAASSVPPPDRISVYVVREGDTLSEIATMFGVSVNTIIWGNDLRNSRDVHPGDTLIILPVSGVEHTVKRGDTFASLARKYKSNADEIALYNGLDTDGALTAGETIIIPGGELAAPASTPRSSSGSYAGGAAQPGYYRNPLPGGIITQAVHGRNGVDVGAARGTPVRAAADGSVIIARAGGAWNGGYGNYVVVTHGNGTQTLYSHMSAITVAGGQTVFAGQIIGYVGTSGLATGPHLHFEVRGAANPLRSCAVGSICALR